MEDLHINTSLEESFNYTNVSDNIYHDLEDDVYDEFFVGIFKVYSWIIICICPPLILVAIYSLSSLVRKDHGAPVYVINLLISDIVQLLCLIVWVADENDSVRDIVAYLYLYGLLTSVGFMVCISLERYLLIAWPLWYRFRRTIKTSVVVSVLVWVLPLVYVLPSYFWVDTQITTPINAIYLLFPFPLFIFFLGGTLKALSTSRSVSSDEKRRIVAVLVVVLLIYTLMFLPTVIWLLAGEDTMSFSFICVSVILLQLSPLADLILYIFIRKGTTDKLLASLCCCRMQFRNHQMNSMNDDSVYTVSVM